MKLLLTVFMLVLLLMSGCDSDSADPAQTEDSVDAKSATQVDSAPSSRWISNPCGLISNQEISALLPNPVAGSVVSRGLCEYAPVDLNLGRVDVDVFVQDVSATGCELFFSVGGFGKAKPVAELDAPARWKGESGAKQLGLCVDEKHALAITIYDPEQKTDPLSAARSIGQLIVGRLVD